MLLYSFFPTAVSLAILLANFGTAIKIFKTPGSLPNVVPASCRASLASDIQCAPRLIKPFELAYDVPFDDDFLNEYCNTTCTTSISTWTSNVKTRCGTTEYNFGTNISQSGAAFADSLEWAHKTACLTGSNSTDYCLPEIVNHALSLCDDCTLKYLAGMASSEFGLGKIDGDGFTTLLSSCKADPTKYPHTTYTVGTPPAAYAAQSRPSRQAQS